MVDEALPNGFLETADIHTASDEYATRFPGATGAWMLDVQERIAMRLLAPYKGGTLLDVGGGHGQLALPLCAAGWNVLVLGSDASCAHRLEPALAAGNCRFQIADMVALPFADDAFDVVICFRLLTHCERWPVLVKELCRVAKKAVLVDYPTSQSVNAIAPALFGAKKKFEKNTRSWRLFKHREVAGAFAENGFSCKEMDKQFFLPMVLHRMVKHRGLSACAEKICRCLGLTRLWGSPVIALFVPETKAEQGI